jgi:hypothetical protein
MMSGMMKGHQDTMARVAAMDDRINALVADMNMFTGEFKVVAMAALLTAIVQRQSVMRDEMRQMHVQTRVSPLCGGPEALFSRARHRSGGFFVS